MQIGFSMISIDKGLFNIGFTEIILSLRMGFTLKTYLNWEETSVKLSLLIILKKTLMINLITEYQ